MEGLSLPFPNARAQQTFFELMLAGYASDTPPERIVRFEGDAGTKRNTWGDPKDWLAIDEWRSTQYGTGSNGTTSIYYNSHLIWEMQYGGWFPDNAIPFLKEALHSQYEKREWYGGRGGVSYSNGAYRYRNDVFKGNSFNRFQGIEFIDLMDSGRWIEIGKHYYRGGFLISNDLTRS